MLCLFVSESELGGEPNMWEIWRPERDLAREPATRTNTPRGLHVVQLQATPQGAARRRVECNPEPVTEVET